MEDKFDPLSPEWPVHGATGLAVLVCGGETQEDDGNTDKVMRLLVQVSSGLFRYQLTPLTQLIRLKVTVQHSASAPRPATLVLYYW